MTPSRLFRGRVVHARSRPKRHRLRYAIFQVLIDLDDPDEPPPYLRLFSIGRRNLLSFHAADHLQGGQAPLRAQVEALLGRAGVTLDGGAIQLLCMPRVLGHAFNPLSLFFCHRADGDLAAILYEVNNTFGERHVYVAPVSSDEQGSPWISHDCQKQFFVSPFMPMALTYQFRVGRLANRMVVQIQVSDGDGVVFFAAFDGAGEAVTDRSLLRAWLGAPLLSLQVLAAIHWEALWIWLKGVPLQARKPVRTMGVTIVPARETAVAA